MEILKKIIFIIAMMWLAWFALSYMDILVHNLSDGRLAGWNVFRILFDGKF